MQPLPNSVGHSTTSGSRVYVKGKFLYNGEDKFFIKGVTYGTFAPQENGVQYPLAPVVDADFRMMAANGINCVRTYTVPPPYLLDCALRYGLKVMAGLPWEQHITFLDAPARQAAIIRGVREGVVACGRHPAVLCFTIGNEIPASIVRWYGREKIEIFLKRLFAAVKAADPSALVTYVNFPTTEYLRLSFLDFVCFNVYLETPEKLGAYLGRLHNLAGDKPLVMAEIGLDSLRNGKDRQAETLAWQVQTVFSKGCAGMFIFAWTDQWWRGGYDIEDWDFGLVDRRRNPKPALAAVRQVMAGLPFASLAQLPLISVVICTYNGAATIRDSLDALRQLDYPSYEVIVVNDGSRDATAAIVQQYPVTLISTANQGLSSARNVGLAHARGEIVAYLDDDAYPDPHWLRYLAYAYGHSRHAGVGGPNLAPPGDGPIARCVANAPGGPVHVLLSDEVAEHIPGCNMSFRREVLLEVGGFDPVYRAAGDDVDICWRVQQTGRTIGFHPAAVVWHHRRNSVTAYWRQQKGYGKAEALLEAKWPEKYNGVGHLTWAGRIYGNGITLPIPYRKDRIFHGTWGTALFQSVYQPADGFLNALPLMPEWYLLTGVLILVAALGFLWAPLLWVWPVVAASVGVVIAQATFSAAKNESLHPVGGSKYKYLALTVTLHLVQPVARLYGRIRHGLTPWRRRGAGIHRKSLFTLRPSLYTHWSEQWRSAEDWLTDLEKGLVARKTRVKRGGDFDAWDLQVKNGLFAKSRCLLAVEEHGGGKQLLRLRCRSYATEAARLATTLLAALSLGSALDGQWLVSGVTTTLLLALGVAFAREKAGCLGSVQETFGGLGSPAGAAPAERPGNDAGAGPSGEDYEETLEQMEGNLRSAFGAGFRPKARVNTSVRDREFFYRKPEDGKA